MKIFTKVLSSLGLVALILNGCGGSSSTDATPSTSNPLSVSYDLNTTLDYNGSLVGDVNITNGAYNSYSFTITADVNNSVVKSGNLANATITTTATVSVSTFAVDVNMSGVDGNFIFNSTIAGVDSGDSSTIVHKFVVTPNHAPVWTASSYNTGLTIRDDNNNPKIIKDLTAVSSDVDGNTLTYTIVSVTSPSVNEDTAWSNLLYIENGVLKVKNLLTNANNIDFNGQISVVVKVSDGTSSSNTTVNFDFLNLN